MFETSGIHQQGNLSLMVLSFPSLSNLYLQGPCSFLCRMCEEPWRLGLFT